MVVLYVPNHQLTHSIRMSTIESINRMFTSSDAQRLLEAHKQVAQEFQRSNAEVKEVAREGVKFQQKMHSAAGDGHLGSRLDVYA
ncbi:hypothetical protein [Endothiovibrio diazotrophicus]